MPKEYSIECPLCRIEMEQVKNIVHKSNKIFFCDFCDGLFTSAKADTETKEIYRQAMLAKHAVK